MATPEKFPEEGFKMENVLKRKINLDVLEAKRKEQALKKREQLKVTTKVNFKPPEQLIMRKRKADRNLVRAKRVSKDSGRYSYEQKAIQRHDAQVALVIRIRGTSGVTPDVNRILNSFNLKSLNSAVFIKLNPGIPKLLKIVEPYVTWGFPSKKTITDLLFKRGHLRIEGARVPITDNVVIEKHFGDLGIICVEDLVHEISHATVNLKTVWRSKCPFPTS